MLSEIHSFISLIEQVALVGQVLSNLDLELFQSKLRGLVLLLPAGNPTLVVPGLTVGGDQSLPHVFVVPTYVGELDQLVNKRKTPRAGFDLC